MFRSVGLRCVHIAVQNTGQQGGGIAVNEGTTSLQGDIATLLEKCRNEPWNAKRCANLVLEMDPFNAEARKYI